MAQQYKPISGVVRYGAFPSRFWQKSSRRWGYPGGHAPHWRGGLPFGCGLNEETLEALSWVFRNRREIAGSGQAVLMPEGPSSDRQQCPFADPLSSEGGRVFTIFADVLAGGVPDPTGGATRFHHHTEAPVWAASMDVCALIGPYLFYRLCVPCD